MNSLLIRNLSHLCGFDLAFQFWPIIIEKLAQKIHQKIHQTKRDLVMAAASVPIMNEPVVLKGLTAIADLNGAAGVCAGMINENETARATP